jgi:protein SCO1/2
MGDCRRTRLRCCVLLLAAAWPAAAAPPLQAVTALGATNGLALACGAADISARARRLMIDYAPRSAQYGAAFERATQQAFREQLNSRRACPAAGELALRLERSAAILRGQATEARPGSAPHPINARYLMLDTHGRMVSNEDFAGRFQLLTFGYTFCPDVCPTTLANMVQIRTRLGRLGERLQLIFITLDPERDDARTLDKYTGYFDAQIVALRGSPELTRAVAEHYSVQYRMLPAPDGPAGAYSVDHTAGMYLLGPDGEFLERFRYDAPPADTAARIAARMRSGPAS